MRRHGEARAVRSPGSSEPGQFGARPPTSNDVLTSSPNSCLCTTWASREGHIGTQWLKPKRLKSKRSQTLKLSKMTESIEVRNTEQLEKLLREQRCNVGRACYHSQMQPSQQNEAAYRENLSKLRAIEQRLRDAQDYHKPSRGIGHVSHHGVPSPPTRGSAFSLCFPPQPYLNRRSLIMTKFFRMTELNTVGRTYLRESGEGDAKIASVLNFHPCSRSYPTTPKVRIKTQKKSPPHVKAFEVQNTCRIIERRIMRTASQPREKRSGE